MRRLVAALSAALLVAQQPEFGVESRLVLVPVTVTDTRGRAVESLTPDDFVLLDNGRPQRVSVDSFATGVAPIALVVVVQSSGISAAALAKVQKIGSMIQPLIVGERGCAALASFDDEVRWALDCTNDAEHLSEAFLLLRPHGDKRARMLDAVREAILRLRARRDVRRVVLVISETRDRGSEVELPRVVSDAEAAGVTIYAATFSAYTTAFTTRPEFEEKIENRKPPGRDKYPLPPPSQHVDIFGGLSEISRLGKTKTTEVLTERTGGTSFSFTRQRGIEDAIEKLGAELHSQYLLSFTPEDAEAGLHRIEVRVKRAGKFVVRARPAYWWTR